MTALVVDEINQEYYKPIERWNQVGNVLFWINTAFSLLSPYAPKLFMAHGMTAFQLVFIFSVLASFVLSQYLSIWRIPIAYRKRRNNLLSNAVGLPMDTDGATTENYYTTLLPASIDQKERLAANIMESAFFTTGVAEYTLYPWVYPWAWKNPKYLFTAKRIFIPILLIWLLTCITTQNLEGILGTIQILFSAEILVGWLKTEYLKKNCNDLYDEMHKAFRRRLDGTPLSEAEIIQHLVNYETAKSSAGVWIWLPREKFNRELNPYLSEKWRKICEQLQIPNQQP